MWLTVAPWVRIAVLSLAAVAFACGGTDPSTQAQGQTEQSFPNPGASDGGVQACQAPSDCTGILPMYCMKCMDGSTACMHWECNQNVCQEAACP